MLIFLGRRGDRKGVAGIVAIYGFGLTFLLFPPIEWPNWIVVGLIALDLVSFLIAYSSYRPTRHRRSSW